jgi:uncharacterized protein YceK
MIKLKLMILFIILITASGCSEFALLVSGASIAGTQNTYARAYNSIDILTIIQTDKDIKKHIYDTIKTNRSTKESH